jgi:lipopolysaccharide transport protein LptA
MRKLTKFLWRAFFWMGMSSVIFCENLSVDDDLPLKIQSDSLKVNYATQEGLYIGNVVADQGTRHLTANHVLLVRDPHLNVFSEIHAFGDMSREAYIELIPKTGEALVKGNADEIIYHPIAHTLIFKGHAELEQKGRIYQGPLAIYNTETQVVDSPLSVDGRVSMIIPPEKIA